MSQGKWNKIAQHQFEQLDMSYQEDWSSLRERVMQR
jgi:hypothetical protein